MKKILSFVLTGCLVLGLFSCNVNVSTKPEKGNNTETETEIDSPVDDKTENDADDENQEIPSEDDENSENKESESSGDTSEAKTVDCSIIETDLGEWTGSVIVPAEKFVEMVNGDYITITTVSNGTAGQTPQLQLMLDDEAGTFLGGSTSLINATYLSQWNCYDLSTSNQSAKLYPSENEISGLKANGLLIKGKGVKVSSVTIRINANLDKTEDTNESDDNGSFKDEETLLDNGQDSTTPRIVHDCKITVQDLGSDWAWDNKVEIPASHFADMESGDFIIITSEKSITSALNTYPQIKLGSNVNWNLQKIGDSTSCSNVSEYNTEYETYTLKAYAQTTRFTPTDSEILILANNGMIIQGQGIVITKVTVHLKDYSAENPNVVGDSEGNVTSTLSDAQATNNAKRLYNFIKANYGKKVITGQMENAWDNNFKQLDKVYADTGKYPALMGFDFIDYTVDWAIESDFNVQTERAINFWNGKDYKGKKISDSNGIVSFCWHWKDPMKETSNESYKPEEINFRIPYDLASDSWKTTSPEYKAMMRDMDLIADELLKLQEAGVPVIWRPFHEGAGNVGKYNGGTAWFWWGAGASITDATDEDRCAEAYIAIWKLMYNYYTKTKGIHNLIWLWNGQNAKFYPGDDYVDIIGDDIYAQKDYSSQKSAFTTYQNMNINVPVALSECGTIPTLENMKKDNAMWSFFMVWNDGVNSAGGSDNFWNSENHNPMSHKLEVYNSTLAITLDDVGDLTTY